MKQKTLVILGINSPIRKKLFIVFKPSEYVKRGKHPTDELLYSKAVFPFQSKNLINFFSFFFTFPAF